MKINQIKKIQPEVFEPKEFHCLKSFRKDIDKNDKTRLDIYITSKTWQEFLDFANTEHHKKGHEACGIILGKYYEDEHGVFIVGSRFEKGTGDSTNAVFCEISYEDSARIGETAKQNNLLQVIWIHSHPGYNAFYSSRDEMTLKSYYYSKHQAGIVVDNIKHQVKSFKILNNEQKEISIPYIIDETNNEVIKPYYKRQTMEIKKQDKPVLKEETKNESAVKEDLNDTDFEKNNGKVEPKKSDQTKEIKTQDSFNQEKENHCEATRKENKEITDSEMKRDSIKASFKNKGVEFEIPKGESVNISYRKNTLIIKRNHNNGAISFDLPGKKNRLLFWLFLFLSISINIFVVIVDII